MSCRMSRIALFACLALAASPSAHALSILEPTSEGITSELQQVQILLPNPLRKNAHLQVVLDGKALTPQQAGPAARDGASSWLAPVLTHLKPGIHWVRVTAQTVAGAEASRVTFYVPGLRPEGSSCGTDFECATLFCASPMDGPVDPSRPFIPGGPRRCGVPAANGERCHSRAGCASHHCVTGGNAVGFCMPDSSQEAYCASDRDCAWVEMCRSSRCVERGNTPHEPEYEHHPDAAEINQHMLDHSMLSH